MTRVNQSNANQIHSSSMTKRILQGAGIALVLIILFLSTVDCANPAWGKFWMVRPLIIVPVAGGIGGVFYYFMDHLRSRGGWAAILAMVISLMGYVIILWFGTVLG